ncbi:MaoC family dehydratase [Variovorax sp. UMC13]|uniref:MaoC family dehydratase n=1 Tax=Variovorax sp. UMC13 TaxID=1862326 RepID=UPI001600ED23|nr:MaoC family dehydratase [Variovorax sp. UMC13]MBB1603793.1 dehydratase [Variovorax sp. UMC13]
MKSLPNYDALQVGDALPAFETEPISRLALALYCGASGDHNPIHVDIDFAHAAGQKDVFAHGMLSMAYLGRLLTNWVPQHALREYGVRFVAITQLGTRVHCRGTVTEKLVVDGERRVRLALETVDQDGHARLAGDAVVALT